MAETGVAAMVPLDMGILGVGVGMRVAEEFLMVSIGLGFHASLYA